MKHNDIIPLIIWKRQKYNQKRIINKLIAPYEHNDVLSDRFTL